MEFAMVTRRQFGFWTGSALLIGPSAVAGELETAGLDALEMTAAFSVLADRDSLVEIRVKNPGKTGITVTLAIAEAVLRHDGTDTKVMSWMNDEDPRSRRIRPPAFVDLAPGEVTLAGKAHVQLDPEARALAGATVALRLRIEAGETSREVTLPPLPMQVGKAES